MKMTGIENKKTAVNLTLLEDLGNSIDRMELFSNEINSLLKTAKIQYKQIIKQTQDTVELSL